MTTVKEILDQFNALFRYNEKVENIDIGDYSFDEAYIDETGYVMEFINSTNPNVWLRINDDRIAVILIIRKDENNVNVTSWRMGKKFNKTFPLEQFQPYPQNERKPLPVKK